MAKATAKTTKLDTQGVTTYKPIVVLKGQGGHVKNERRQNLRRVGNKIGVKHRNKILPVTTISKGKVECDILAKPLAVLDGKSAQDVAPALNAKDFGSTKGKTAAKGKATTGKATKSGGSMDELTKKLVNQLEKGDEVAAAATFTSLLTLKRSK